MQRSVFIITLVLAALACSLPGGAAPDDPGAVFTAAAQTVEAEMTSGAQGQEGTPDPAVSETPEPTGEAAAQTDVPCNAASFVTDVTIPDGTEIVTSQPFTKTWRLRNTGSCTWTSGYLLVFKSGDAMGGPASQQLTGGTVAPGATVDVSVNLTAPASAGTYKGFWELREPGGTNFGLSTGAFWVEIKAVAPTVTPGGIIIVTLFPIFPQTTAALETGESGSVRSNGSVLTVTNVGDLADNASSQAFLSFNISAIPAGSTITEVKIDFSNYDMLGSPFSLGCLRMYKQDYGTLDSGDFFVGTALGAVARWCNASELSAVSVGSADMKAAVQSYVGGTRAKFRVQFNQMATNNNGIADMVRLGSGIKLIITYTLP
jgi:hypothetical protein